MDRILLAIAAISATSFLSSSSTFCSTDFVSGLIPCIILHLRGQSLSVLHEFQPFENALHQTTTNKGQLQCDMAVSSHLFFLSLQLNIFTEIRARQQQQQSRCLITTHKLAAFPGSQSKNSCCNAFSAFFVSSKSPMFSAHFQCLRSRIHLG